MHEAADVRLSILDCGDAEVSAAEGVELDGLPFTVFRWSIVSFESEVAMRVIANERASQLRVESSPTSPPADDDARADLPICVKTVFGHRGHRARIERLRTGGFRVAEQQVVEQTSRHTAGGLRKIEFVRPPA